MSTLLRSLIVMIVILILLVIGLGNALYDDLKELPELREENGQLRYELVSVKELLVELPVSGEVFDALVTKIVELEEAIRQHDNEMEGYREEIYRLGLAYGELEQEKEQLIAEIDGLKQTIEDITDVQEGKR